MLTVMPAHRWSSKDKKGVYRSAKASPGPVELVVPSVPGELSPISTELVETLTEVYNNPRGPSRQMGPQEVKALCPAILQLAAENVPDGTLCAALGIPTANWEMWQTRYPLLMDEVRRLRALAAIASQRIVAKGGQGWQAHMTMLERLDAATWSRQYVAGVRKNSPLAAAIGKEPRAGVKNGKVIKFRKCS